MAARHSNRLGRPASGLRHRTDDAVHLRPARALGARRSVDRVFVSILPRIFLRGTSEWKFALRCADAAPVEKGSKACPHFVILQ
jgi:hypothetical protein